MREWDTTHSVYLKLISICIYVSKKYKSNDSYINALSRSKVIFCHIAISPVFIVCNTQHTHAVIQTYHIYYLKSKTAFQTKHTFLPVEYDFTGSFNVQSGERLFHLNFPSYYGLFAVVVVPNRPQWVQSKSQ